MNWLKVYFSVGEIDGKSIGLAAKAITEEFHYEVKIDELTLLNSADLTFDEIDNLRTETYDYQSKCVDTTLYKKLHNAYIMNFVGSLLNQREIPLIVIEIQGFAD